MGMWYAHNLISCIFYKLGAMFPKGCVFMLCFWLLCISIIMIVVVVAAVVTDCF